MKNFYNIHNLVSIVIETGNPRILKEYEYHIRTFKVDALPEPPDVAIFDFKKFQLPPDALNIHNSLFGFESGVCDKEKKYAITVKGGLMSVYLEEPALCLNTLLQYIALRKDTTFIHGAGISYKNKGIIFPAPPNVGKTLLVSRLRNKEHIQIFGDDYLMVDKDGLMRSFPADFSIYRYHFNFFPELKKTAAAGKIQRAFYEKFLVAMVRRLSLKAFARKAAALIGYEFLQGGEYVKVPANTLIGKGKMGTRAPLEYAVFLNKYNGSEFTAQKIDAHSAPSEILGILQSEWFETLPACHALSLFGVMDFGKYIEETRQIVASAFGKLKIYRVLIPAGMDSKEHIDKLEAFLEREIFSQL
ncbi:hypothetical protein KW786_01810 [Candidatus Parcubacteria bacterium]|nr:hypothetical protein [Candidatus Parcubacteria bacterium]